MEGTQRPTVRQAAIAAILAGGAGRRIGGAKALVPLAGRALIDYPLAAAHAADLETVVVAKADSGLPVWHDDQARIVREPATPRHPLCGLVTALREVAIDDRAVLALACDMPFVEPALLAWLARQPGETVACEVGGQLQPFPALYRRSALAVLEPALEGRRPLRRTLERLAPDVIEERELRAFGDPERMWLGVNDGRDLQIARTWLHDDG